MNTSSNNPTPNAPDPLAVALSKLDPAPHGFDWNSLMFAAGRESKARALAFWRFAAVLCALVACGFAYFYLTRPTLDRIVVVERAPAQFQKPPTIPQQLPGPVVLPGAKPEVRPEPKPVPLPSPATQEPSSWSFEESPVEQGAAARWLNLRNEVLTVGLSVLPDSGRKVSPPRGDR